MCTKSKRYTERSGKGKFPQRKNYIGFTGLFRSLRVEFREEE